MTLALDHVGIGSEPGAALPVVSAVAAPGTPGVVALETEQAPVLASLVAGGRMRPEHGRVLLDERDDAAAVRRRFALVDTPGVAEPFPVTNLRRIVREELVYAGRRPTRDAVATVLDALGLEALADTQVQHVPTAARTRLLVELALLRDGVDGIVLTTPERHGGAVADWYAVVRDVARRGTTVLLVTSAAAAETVVQLQRTDAAAAAAAAAAADQADRPDDATVRTGGEQRLQADRSDDAAVPTGGEQRLQTDPSTGNEADATTAPEARS